MVLKLTSALARRMSAANWAITLVGIVALAGCGTDNAGDDGNAAVDVSGADDTSALADAAGVEDAVDDVWAADAADAEADTSVAADDTGADDASAATDGTEPTDAAADASDDAAADASDDASDALADVAVDDAGNPLWCGKPCADNELCEAGTCVANKPPCGGPCASGLYCEVSSGTCQTSVCTLPSSFGPAQKVASLTIAESSDGCDLNGDGKPNNVFGKLLKVYPAANTELQKSINDSLFVLLMDAVGWDFTGKPFSVNIWLADFASSSSGCSPTSPDANCSYTIDDNNFAGGPTGQCKPQAVVQPMTIAPGTGDDGLMAGGGDVTKKMTIVLPVVGGLDFTMSAVQIDQANVTAPGGWASTADGRICGVMTVVDFDKALASVPPEGWASINLEPETIKLLVKAFLNPDIDLNKDGVPDAMSVALRFKTVPGTIDGVTY